MISKINVKSWSEMSWIVVFLVEVLLYILTQNGLEKSIL